MLTNNNHANIYIIGITTKPINLIFQNISKWTTKKQIEYPHRVYSWEVRDDRMETLMDKDLSVEGLKALDKEVHAAMGSQEKFSFMAYKAALQERLESLTG